MNLPRASASWSAQDRARAQQLRAQGMTYAQIAAAMGRTKQAAWTMVNGAKRK